MSSPKLATVGVSGSKVVFVLHGKSYTTGALTPGQAPTEAQANALIASGQATPDANNYVAQFPWSNPPR